MRVSQVEDDAPEAYKMLDAFNWTTEDMESVMLDISEGMSPKKAAEKWIEENKDRVEEVKKRLLRMEKIKLK